MCGGRGKRLGHLTDINPKPLTEINGKAILGLKIDQYIKQGFQDYIFCIGYKGKMIKEYIAKEYGETALKDISISLSKPFNYSINRAIKETIGITGEELYSNWKGSLEKHYTQQISNIQDKKDYTILESDGEANINPRWSPNSKKIAYLSNKERDYFGRTDLFVYTLEDSTHEKIVPGIKSIPAWINDSLIVYTKISEPNKDGSKYFDLYQYNFETENYKNVGCVPVLHFSCQLQSNVTLT